MEPMVVNFTTEASRLAVRAVAGLLLLACRPFASHDHISVTGYEGPVAGVDPRYTTLQREDGKVLIPNSILFTNPIQLLGRTPYPVVVT